MSESQDTILIGVDGGGTGCRAAIAYSDQVIVSTATGGPANAATGYDAALQNVLEAINSAARSAGIDADSLKHASVHLGLAGVMDQEVAGCIAAALPFAHVTVTDDRPTAVAGALGDQDGFLIAVGTGTITAARKADDIRYVGGWGFYLADQASGAWLGRRLLEETMLSYDTVKPHSSLTKSVLKKFDDDPNNMVAFSVTALPKDFGSFAPLVITTAKAGDTVAISILKEGASFLEQGVQALGFRPGDRVCLSGGVGPFYTPYLASKYTANLIEPAGTSVNGAIYLAAQNKRIPQEVET